jgi:ribonuclease HII
VSDYIIGCDECGTGAWAGPFVVCAVAAPTKWHPPPGLRDSKRYPNHEARRKVYDLLAPLGLTVRLAKVSNLSIDKLGLGKALRLAHTTVIMELLDCYPDADVILDGTTPLPRLPQIRCEARADSKYPVVMAASVIGKVNRDLLMQEYDSFYPEYGFASNVGYGSSEHQHGLAIKGPCAIHRMSYKPLKKFAGKAVP